MKKNTLFLVVASLTGLLAGYFAWGYKYSSELKAFTSGAGVTFELTSIDSVKKYVKEYRESLPYPDHKGNLYGFYIPYSLFDKNFGPEGLSSSDIASLRRPGGTNSAGVYYAKRGRESFSYLVFSDINGSRPNDAENHIYKINGLNINIHRVLANHVLTKKLADADSSDVEILHAHRTCQGNCPDWYPKD